MAGATASSNAVMPQMIEFFANRDTGFIMIWA
jgi:hypothetical protein